MMVEPMVQVDPRADLQAAVAALTKVTENVEIVRWMEFPNSLLLFLLVPGDPESGAVYVLDRKKGTWYSVDFEDDQFGGYSVSQLEMLLKECRFLDLVERPALWRTGLPWVLVGAARDGIPKSAIATALAAGSLMMAGVVLGSRWLTTGAMVERRAPRPHGPRLK
jgi:hypothetical protein